MVDDRTGRLTQLLVAAGEGDEEAAAEVLPLVYEELRQLARAQMAKVPPGNTLQPTALVHEAYLRLFTKEDMELGETRRHFFAAAVRAMRDILVEQARRKKRRKRGGDRKRVDVDDLDELGGFLEAPVNDILALDEALTQLESENQRLVEVVKLRFFAGLTTEETSDVLGVSVSTVEREWRFARALLYTQLGGSDAGRRPSDR